MYTHSIATLKPGDVVSFRLSGKVRYKVISCINYGTTVSLELEYGNGQKLTASYFPDSTCYIHYPPHTSRVQS